MKSVSIMWAEGVTEDEARTVVGTVRDLLKAVYDVCLKAGVLLAPTAIRPFGTWVIPSLPPGDPYSGTHWYIDTAYDRALGQVVGPKFLDLVRNEPWQRANPHYDVAVLDRDLADPERQAAMERAYVLASVLPGTATVISVRRLRELSEESTRLRALRRLVVHNFGHVLDVPAPSREAAVAVVGGERHCTNLCVMRHAGSVGELVRACEEEDAAGILLCPECRNDVLRSVLKQRLSSN
jgi:predicted Zn-dependent protease